MDRRPDQPIYVPPSIRARKLREKKDPDVQEHDLQTTAPRPDVNKTPKLNKASEVEASSRAYVPPVFRHPVNEDLKDLEASFDRIHLSETKHNAIRTRPEFRHQLKHELSQLNHVLELYDLNKAINTTSIEEALFRTCGSDFSLKWVNDSHCLLILASDEVAERVMKGVYLTNFKIRPVNEASAASRSLLLESDDDWLKPFKKRPDTDTAVVHRLITRHLGVPQDKHKAAYSQKTLDLIKEQKRRRDIEDSLWNDP